MARPQATIDQLLGMAGEESYSLPMAGTALSGAGVMDGDIIVFSRVIEPVTNDIVLATVNGALYIRRFVTHRGTVFCSRRQCRAPNSR